MSHLDSFSGNWTSKEARHLLKRTSFGVTQSLVNEAVSLGLTETINTLFAENPLPEPPLKYVLEGTENGQAIDPDTNYGKTWVNGNVKPVIDASTSSSTVILKYRTRSLYAWSFLQMQNRKMSIREKLTLFWHNHFVSVYSNPHIEYYYMNKLRSNSLGNFKEISKQITIDPNMLRYLSGRDNTNIAPNENYSREVYGENMIFYDLFNIESLSKVILSTIKTPNSISDKIDQQRSYLIENESKKYKNMNDIFNKINNV